jgi:hypothetical protein
MSWPQQARYIFHIPLIALTATRETTCRGGPRDLVALLLLLLLLEDMKELGLRSEDRCQLFIPCAPVHHFAFQG